jgi:nitrite reductase/ring-hydroxylating ferredoxin subunit
MTAPGRPDEPRNREWVTVGAVDELFDRHPPSTCVSVADGRAVVARHGATVKAFLNRCLHQDAPLAGGWVGDETLSCPMHFWRYRLADGQHVGGQGVLTSLQVEEIDGQLRVEAPIVDDVPIRELLRRNARRRRPDASLAAPPVTGRYGQSEEDQ